MPAGKPSQMSGLGRYRLSSLPLPQQSQMLEGEVEFHPGAWENPRLRLPASLQPHGPCAESQHGPPRALCSTPCAPEGWEVVATLGRWAVRLHPRWRSRRIQRTLPITLIFNY